MADWAVQRIRLDGRPFSFEGHEYLRTIYNETSRHVVLSKAAQIGGSTWAILRAIHACLQGLNVAYFFPTRQDVIEFSKSRVNPLLADNPFLARTIADVDSAGLKRIGDAHLHFRGMVSKVQVKNVPADLIVFDELDETTPEAKTMAKERLGHSDYKRIIELSNPSLPDYGIDAAYLLSDQRHWTNKCPACGAWVALDKEFPLKPGQEVRIIRARPDDTFYRACPKCEAELDLAKGEWVADFPDRPTRGYRISQLFSSRVDPGEILSEYRTSRFLDRFYQLKIGVPWADLERRLDIASVLSLCSETPVAEGSEIDCAMGVDTGRDLHVVILRHEHGGNNQARVIHLAVCSTFSDLDGLIQRFNVGRCVIDGLPETHATRDFAQRNLGKVYLCFFNEHQRGRPNFDVDKMTVLVNRTEILDASRAAVRDQKVIFPRQERAVEVFAQHMAADAKILDEDPETGARKYRYVRTGPDHFSLAFTYGWLALPELFVLDLNSTGWF